MYTDICRFVQNLPKKPEFNGVRLHWRRGRRKTTALFNAITVARGDLDRASLAPVRLGSFLPNNRVFINFINAAGSDERSRYTVIQSKNHGRYIGPSNGFIAAMRLFLNRNRIGFRIGSIDIEKVERFLSGVMGIGGPILNLGWAGRDISAVVGGAIAGGLKARTFHTESMLSVDAPVPPFIAAIKPLGNPRVGVPIQCIALPDSGDLKLSLSCTKSELWMAADEDRRFTIERIGHRIEDAQVCSRYQDVRIGRPAMISSGSFGLCPGQYLFEVGIREGNINKVLELPATDAPYEITLIRTR